MSDLPPLPETNDPHELLGVSEDADELTIKRAYLRLIRTYRPEIAAEAFQRLHQAYERALQYLQWQHWIEPATSEDEDPAETPAEDPMHASLREAWHALEAGKAEDARRRVESASRDRPDSALAVAHRALLTEALGTPAERAAQPLVSLLGKDEPVAAWITSLFQPRDVDEALAGSAARWARLRASPIATPRSGSCAAAGTACCSKDGRSTRFARHSSRRISTMRTTITGCWQSPHWRWPSPRRGAIQAKRSDCSENTAMAPPTRTEASRSRTSTT